MIKINLGQKSKKMSISNYSSIQVSEEMSQRKAIVNLFLILMIPALLAVYETQTIPSKKLEIQKVNKERSELQKFNQDAAAVQERIKKLNEDQSKLSSKIKILSSLKTGRVKEVRMLDLVQTQIPEQVWLTSIELTDQLLRIQGYSTKDSEVSIFIERMNKESILSNLTLIKSSRENFPSIGFVTKFEINGAVDRGGF
jgi:Tfp pilus assembly protein PilN